MYNEQDGSKGWKNMELVTCDNDVPKSVTRFREGCRNLSSMRGSDKQHIKINPMSQSEINRHASNANAGYAFNIGV